MSTDMLNYNLISIIIEKNWAMPKYDYELYEIIFGWE